ncbi:MAG: flagellar basal body P-ring protein FlgI [Caulobacterales bacterium]|nr:flagellar basal body P-ring protein FlgI [Caulobacterales bacterium]
MIRDFVIRDVLIVLILAIFALGTVIGASDAAHAASRIKDIADVEGVRDNQLVGYGLVVGLDGTGDGLRNSPFTKQSLEAMLERLGVNTREANLNTRNTAAVMVTANLPPFSVHGTRFDVTVSALGDAKSLSGGVLLVTPLYGADGEVYAVAQGSVAIAGFSAGGDAASITRGVPTVGRIANGALLEREAPYDLASQPVVRLSLRNPDFATAARMTEAINRYLGVMAARATSPAVVELARPPSFAGDMVGLLTEVEQLMVEPQQAAKIVIDEASGVVVIGESVRVSTVAVAQGSLTVSVRETPVASQAEALAPGGETVVLPRTDVETEEDLGGLVVLDQGVALQDLVDGLNALGVSPRDLITILQGLKTAGAIQADIETM